MSTIKSSAENLTLNADGANNDIKFQSNGSEVASIDQAGTITATTFTGAGSTPSITDNGNATAITIDSSEQVGIANTSPNSYDAEAKNLVVGSGTGHQGMTIVAGTSSKSKIHFADGTGAAAYQGMLYYDHSNNRLSIATATTDRIKIDSDGLKFNADTAAANALDDYEEGAWTPVWDPTTSGSITTNTTYTAGRYTKVGNLVTVSWRLYTNSVNSPAGKLTINGLPFTVANDARATPKILFPILGLSSNLAGSPIGTVNGNTTTVTVADYVWGVTEGGADIAQKFDNDVWSYGTFTYFT